jgi:hypothetical protein
MKLKKVLFFFSICFLAFAIAGYGQQFVGKTETWCKQNVSKGKLQPKLLYNEQKICIREIYLGEEMAECEKIVKHITQDTTYGWIRINENQWVSNFTNQLLTEIHELNKGCRTQVLRTEWTKELYELLLQK